MSEPRGGLVATVPGQEAPLGVESVPLTGVRIEVKARGTASAVTVSQRYVNRETVPVEAVYSFPLEEQAAVYGFEAVVDGRRVVGRVLEKDEAFDEYDEAMAAGHGAYLLDQDRANLFTASVGNLLPGQDVVVTLRYVAPLERLGDQIRLKVPATVAPRYIPVEQLRRMDPSEFDHLNPPTALGGVQYGLELAVDFAAASRVTALECPSHPARVSMRGKTARVELSGADLQLDQDVVVTFTMKDAGETALYVVRDDQGDHVLQLDVMPAGEAARSPVEAVFLVDRSGSMDGSSMEQARNALLLALGSLREGDRFNVVGFGSYFEMLFEGSVPYDDVHLDAAREAIGDWDADLGGTELLAPLAAILEAPAGELPRRLLVLTDGEVADEAECHGLVRRHAHKTSVFALGVGYGASDLLVRGLARAGRGEAEFVHPGERIEPAVLRQVARLTAGGLRDVSIDWAGLPVDLTAPAQLPPLFPGTPLTVWARVPASAVTVDGTVERPVEVALVATGPEGQVRLTAAADLGGTKPDAAVSRLFAREAIRDLEEGHFAAARRGSSQRDRREARARAEIIELSKRYGILSSETSFVAVEEREGEAAADLPAAELRRIPVALLKDWHGCGRSPKLAMTSDFRANEFCDSDEPDDCFAPSKRAPRAGRGPDGLDGRAMGAVPEPGTRTERLNSTAPELRLTRADVESIIIAVSLVALQHADGSWSLGDSLFLHTLDLTESQVDQAFAKPKLPREHRDEIAATLLALHALRTACASSESTWRLAAEKAETWLAARLPAAPPSGFESFAAWVANRLSWWKPVGGADVSSAIMG